MIKLLDETHDCIMATKLSGKLGADDYNQLFPLVAETIEHHGKVKWYLELENFKGWDLKGLWDEIKLNVKHFDDVERIALVGPKDWEEKVFQTFKNLTTAEVRYFTSDQKTAAKAWIEEKACH